MSIITYNPFRDFFGIDPLFQDDMGYSNVSRPRITSDKSNQLVAPLDIWEEGDMIKGRMDVPGFSKDCIKVEIVNGNVLKLTGERKEDSKENMDRLI
ncbi:hypothetical protein HDU92_008195, partial [Lobulomyces angularis]